MYLAPFNDFLIACVGASASFIGLLFVALSVVLARNDNSTIIEFTERRLAESSFTSLTNIFFVSLIALMPGTNIGYPALVLALLSLLAIARLFRQFKAIDKKDILPQNTRDVAWLFVSVIIYGAEGIYGLLLILHPANASYLSMIMNILLSLFGAAIVRTWGLTGIRAKN
jgi:hypothetical protein